MNDTRQPSIARRPLGREEASTRPARALLTPPPGRTPEHAQASVHVSDCQAPLPRNRQMPLRRPSVIILSCPLVLDT
jgi:hypothetical protein